MKQRKKEQRHQICKTWKFSVLTRFTATFSLPHGTILLPSLSFSVTPSTVLFSSVHVLMSQDYLKTALPSQVMSERGSNLVVINPGMRKIQFCTLPTCYLLPIITSTRSKSKLEHLKIVTLLRWFPLLRRFCKYKNWLGFTGHPFWYSSLHCSPYQTSSQEKCSRSGFCDNLIVLFYWLVITPFFFSIGTYVLLHLLLVFVFCI